MENSDVVYWFRLQDRKVAEREQGLCTVEVLMHKLAVIKTTPKGVKLIGLQYGDKTARFVAHASKKKFACATIEEAVESFKKRKERQANIYRVKASNADKAYNIAVAGFYNTMPNWFNRKMFEETCNGN